METNIMITEIMQNPDMVSDANGEWFEIYNAGTGAVDVNGWTIRDLGVNEHRINNGGGLLIGGMSFLLLGCNSNALDNGGVVLDYEYSSITLGNADDEIILLNSATEEITRVEYDGGPNWPDPEGASMYLVAPGVAPNSGGNWAVSTRPWLDSAGDAGSPGRPNASGIWDDGGDHDVDGMPDWWEHRNFVTGTNTRPDADADGDNMDNYAEWVAGTQPTNDGSVFEVQALASATRPVLSWPGVSNRRYAVEYTTNLLSPFVILDSNIPPVLPMNTYTDTVHADEHRLFYHIEVSLP
jgi:hypothetical protein